MISKNLQHIIISFYTKKILCYDADNKQINFFDGKNFQKWCSTASLELDIVRLQFINRNLYLYSSNQKFRFSFKYGKWIQCKWNNILSKQPDYTVLFQIGCYLYYFSKTKILKHDGSKWKNALVARSCNNYKNAACNNNKNALLCATCNNNKK